MLNRALEIVFPRQPLSDFCVDHTSTQYAERLERIAPPDVDSEAGRAQVQMFATTEPGVYLGHGDFVQRAE